MMLHCFVLFALLSFVRAQNYSVPSSWQLNTGTARSRDERIHISQTVLQQVRGLWNKSSGLFDKVGGRTHRHAVLYSSLARGDYLASTHISDDLLAKVESNAQPNPDEDWIGVPLIWGITALDFYYTHKNDSQMLKVAQNVFDRIASYQISQKDAESGTHPLRTVSFVSSCGNSKTVAGGVFAVTNSDRTDVSGYNTGYFAVLSSYLAEIEAQTGGTNTTYREAATLGAQFLLNHLVNEDLVVATLGISPDACASRGLIEVSTCGALIESFVVLANVTGDTKWSNTSINVLLASTQAVETVERNGVLKALGTILYNDPNFRFGRGLFIRSLNAPLTRLGSNTPLRDYINAFITVQYNTLLSHASSGDTGFYSPNWNDPQATGFSVNGMLEAVDVLNAAIELPFTAPSSTSSTPPSETHDGDNKNHNDGKKPHALSKAALIGVGVGASLLALLIILIIFFYIRRRRRRRHNEHISGSPEESTPFRAMIPPQMHATTAQVVSSTHPEKIVLTYNPPRRQKGGTAPRRHAGIIPHGEQSHSAASTSNAEDPTIVSHTTSPSLQEGRDGQPNQDLAQIVDGLLRDRGLGDSPPRYQTR